MHFIFSTHGRRPFIKSDFRTDLFAYLGGIIREMNGTALIINGDVDHAQMLIRVRPAHAAAEVARVVKTNSSRWVRERHRPDFAWQTGYGVFSVSESNVASVTEYIAGQLEHHKKRSFQEESVAFLKKNHIEYDERYIGIERARSGVRSSFDGPMRVVRSRKSFLSPFQGFGLLVWRIPTACAAG